MISFLSGRRKSYFLLELANKCIGALTGFNTRGHAFSKVHKHPPFAPSMHKLPINRRHSFIESRANNIPRFNLIISRRRQLRLHEDSLIKHAG